MNQEKDQRLWKTAKARVKFKRHLYTYLAVNLLLWLLWAIGAEEVRSGRIPWPIWPSLGWGIGLAFNYFGAYGSHNESAIEQEYQKLKDRS